MIYNIKKYINLHPQIILEMSALLPVQTSIIYNLTKLTFKPMDGPFLQQPPLEIVEVRRRVNSSALLFFYHVHGVIEDRRLLAYEPHPGLT